ncbi:hypothetical protein NA57DRAFT_36752 [Rhizodiscina lignyota]|uniref:Arrestin-like N-terminal domain-containing protein n=1 Tax=Rhizodiscina lignyota TaxID=1504668 RepID=A0A9P4MB48_9PEZI|nr:hypothetical protein NA57DRAFT_36752 [Rhizodiscina lignyota]
MNVNLFLDKPRNHFTNLDEITGKVVLKTSSANAVNNITVKLEGESRTRLISQGRPGYNDKPRPVLEVHKLLYKVQVVWPPRQVTDQGGFERNYTIPPGIHEYPFSFKIPFNNACNTPNPLQLNSSFMGLSLEVARTPTHHVKTTLPPTLYFPGEAEIRYYCKVTVNRPQLLQQNPRAIVPFNFFPIEPPRQRSDGETYARRQHQFQNPDLLSPSPTTMSAPDDAFKTPPRFSVDARLPNPAIITCNEDLPVRIIVKQLSERDQPVYLQSLQVVLIGYTLVRAHEVQRRESNSWVLVTAANMGVPLGSPSDPVGAETEINKEYWFGRQLPNTVAPTFVTCNLKREYELEISVGLGYGTEKGGQMTVLPLRLPVKVFSGIRPPAALLEAMHNSPPEKLPLKPPRRESEASPVYDPSPTGMQSSYLPSPTKHSQPPQAHVQSSVPPGYDDAPPSYEDAIASDLPPVDGPRPDYEPPPAPVGDGLGARDEKRGGFGLGR